MKFLLPLFTLLMCGACSFNELQHTLRATLQLAQEHPDSALQQLRSLDTDRFYSRRLKADYALVYSILLDKNYIDQQSDSLIHIPYDYYGSHATSDSVRHLVHYYRGRIHQNNREFHPATREYLTALHHLDTLRKPYECGLIYSRLGAMYRAQHNHQNALRCFQRAYEHHCRSKRPKSIHHAMFNIANSLHTLDRFEESEDWYQRVLQSADTIFDPNAIWHSYSNLLVLYRDSGKNQAVIETAKKMEELPYSAFAAVDYMCIANAYLREGDIARSKEYLHMAELLPHDNNNLFFNHLQFEIAVKEHSFEEAVKLHGYIQQNINDIKHAYNTSVARAEKEFYAEQSLLHQYRLKIKNRLIILAILVSFVVIIVLITYYKYRIRHKEEEIFNFMANVRELQEEYDELQCKMQNQQNKESRVRLLLNDQYKILDELCRTFFERDSTRAQQEQIYREVQTRMQALSEDPKTAEKLEQIINTTHNDLMLRLKEQLPQFTENDFLFLRLVYAGFSAQVISLITHESIHNTYARKHRLKKRMMQSNAPDKELFINALR